MGSAWGATCQTACQSMGRVAGYEDAMRSKPCYKSVERGEPCNIRWHTVHRGWNSPTGITVRIAEQKSYISGWADKHQTWPPGECPESHCTSVSLTEAKGAEPRTMEDWDEAQNGAMYSWSPKLWRWQAEFDSTDTDCSVKKWLWGMCSCVSPEGHTSWTVNQNRYPTSTRFCPRRDRHMWNGNWSFTETDLEEAVKWRM